MSRKIKKHTTAGSKKSLANVSRTLQEAFNAHRCDDLAKAECLYRSIISAHPKQTDALNLLATLYQQQGKFSEAIPLLVRAIAIQPTCPDYHSNLGSAFRSMGEHEKASSAFNKALSLNPGHVESQFNLAMTRWELGDVPGATQGFRSILSTKPSFIPACEMLVQILLGQGRLDEALLYLNEITHFSPQHGAAFFESGNILQAQKKLPEAVKAYEHAITLDPTYAVAHNNLGNTLVKMGKLHDALGHYQKAIRYDPELSEAYINLSWTYKEHGMLAEDIACLNSYLQRHPEDHRAHSDMLFSMNYDPSYSPGQLCSAAKEWWVRHAPPVGIHFDHCLREPSPKIRIGFLSPDFRQHPVGTFIVPLFSAINKQSVTLHCYAEMSDQQMDAVTTQIRCFADTWTCTLGLSAEEAAKLIHQDHIDILIDLAGHSANNRLDIISLKPAPVQVSWLGYVNTTGLPVIDYRITDAVADPPGEENCHSERLFRMPDAFFCYKPDAEAPDIGPLPALANGAITFGSLNNPSKINIQVIAAWAKILRQVPRSKLVMVGASFADEFIANRYRLLFTTQGVENERITFRTTMPMREYLDFYNTIDIALDPFPHNGHTITCHTLWMGVPVISLRGNRYAARMGASVLVGSGFPELVAPTIPEYISRATALAHDLNRLSELRSTLRTRLSAASICNTTRFAQDFVNAMKLMAGAGTETTDSLHFHS